MYEKMRRTATYLLLEPGSWVTSGITEPWLECQPTTPWPECHCPSTLFSSSVSSFATTCWKCLPVTRSKICPEIPGASCLLEKRHCGSPGELTRFRFTHTFFFLHELVICRQPGSSSAMLSKHFTLADCFEAVLKDWQDSWLPKVWMQTLQSSLFSLGTLKTSRPCLLLRYQRLLTPFRRPMIVRLSKHRLIYQARERLKSQPIFIPLQVY